MKKDQKALLIAEIAENIDSSDAIYAVDYRGLSVPQAAQLRTSLREVDASFKIVKNTLTLRAADKSSGAGAEQIKAFVGSGPTALTFIKGDPAAAAKALDSFAKEHNVLDFKGGTLGDQALTADDIRGIAKLPSRDALNAQLAGVVASPLTTLVRGLGSMVSGMAIALGQVLAQKEAEAPATEAAPKAEEPKADSKAEETSESSEEQASDETSEEDSGSSSEQPDNENGQEAG